MRTAEMWLCALGFAVTACGSQTGRGVMNPSTSKDQLARQIENRNTEGAKALARSMPPGDSGEVLRKMAENEKASVRMLVLELAGENPSEGASRAVLSRLQDSNLTVGSI